MFNSLYVFLLVLICRLHTNTTPNLENGRTKLLRSTVCLSKPTSDFDLRLGLEEELTTAHPAILVPVPSIRENTLREILVSERAYASDLTLVRDIYVPMVLGRLDF